MNPLTAAVISRLRLLPVAMAAVIILAGLPASASAAETALPGSVQPALRSSSMVAHHSAELPLTLILRPGLAAGQVKAVETYMAAQGFSLQRRFKHNAGLRYSGSVAKVESTFGTTINDYQRGGRSFYANASPIIVPVGIASYVVGVLDLDNAVLARPLQVSTPFPSGATPPYTPAELKHFYHLDQLNASGFDGTGRRIGIVTFATFAISDVRAFESAFNLPKSTIKVTTAPALNGQGPGAAAGGRRESTLDVTWSSAMAPGAEVDVVEAANGDWVGALDTMFTLYSPDVISISWGAGDACTGGFGIDGNTQDAFHSALTTINSSRVPVLVASGDTGSRECVDFSGDLSPAASWPSTDPAITAVGGTRVDPDANGLPLTESSWRCTVCDANDLTKPGGGASGGGFSDHWSTADASFQSSSNAASSGKRGVPDVSLLGDANTGYVLRFGGGWENIGGTSAATPALAGIIAAANQAHGSALTDANSFFYGASHTTCWNDIQDGGTNGDYTAGSGWDPVTGLGSVYADQLLTALSGGTCGAITAPTGPDFTDPPPSIKSISPNFGSPGDTVTINGKGLSAITLPSQVMFGGVSATSLVGTPSDTKVQVTAPSGSGFVQVTISTDGGSTTPSNKYVFSYAPIVKKISPTFGAGGTAVTISGANFGTNPTISFNGVALTSTCTVTAQPGCVRPNGTSTSITVQAPAYVSGPSTVAITVTSSGGTSDTSGLFGADSFSYAPIVKKVTPAIGSWEGGTLVTLRGSNFGSTPQVAFGGGTPIDTTSSVSQCITTTQIGCWVSVRMGTIKVHAPAYVSGAATVDVTVNSGGLSSDTSGAFGSDKYTYAPVITGLSPKSVSISTLASDLLNSLPLPTLTIKGAGLSGATSVKIGGLDAAIQSNSDTALTVSIPAPSGLLNGSTVVAAGFSGKVNVQVTANGLTSLATATSRFTYIQ